MTAYQTWGRGKDKSSEAATCPKHVQAFPRSLAWSRHPASEPHCDFHETRERAQKCFLPDILETDEWSADQSGSIFTSLPRFHRRPYRRHRRSRLMSGGREKILLQRLRLRWRLRRRGNPARGASCWSGRKRPCRSPVLCSERACGRCESASGCAGSLVW